MSENPDALHEHREDFSLAFCVTRIPLVTSVCFILPLFLFLPSFLAVQLLSGSFRPGSLHPDSFLLFFFLTIEGYDVGFFFSRNAVDQLSSRARGRSERQSFEAASVYQYLIASGYEYCLDTREIARRESIR